MDGKNLLSRFVEKNSSFRRNALGFYVDKFPEVNGKIQLIWKDLGRPYFLRGSTWGPSQIGLDPLQSFLEHEPQSLSSAERGCSLG